MLDLQLIEEDRRRTEEELDRAFEAVQPAVLGALLDLLACVLAVLPTVRLGSMPRMADFARVLAAVDQVQEWKTLDAYLATTANLATDALEGDPFGAAIATLVEQAGTWRETAQLLEALPLPGPIRPQGWPKDATRAGGRVKRLALLLRSIGITVDDTQRSPDRHRHKLLIVFRAAPEEEPASAADQASLWPEVAPIGQGRTPTELH
ncbi:hypothetical protein [Streptomyces purpurogeneiscleroticus]|uniref:hypothetical protein n=1 Tax=Streptomyces purpurogeneiscleroticus TaxID=68259 RepID=UPI001CBF69A7|nr:hypothetical protein [Streptomyces purpurogeneiscleroticus]